MPLAGSCHKAEVAASTEVSRGRAYYTTCAGCHGNDGEGLKGMNAPRLAGLPAAYVTRQLTHFRSGVRGGAADFYGVAMNGRARALGEDKAVEDVAAFVATLPKPAPVPAHGGGDVSKGRVLFETCATCHGAKGEGNAELDAPVLAGSADWYVARQLANFKSGVRGRDGDEQGAQMRVAAQTLPDEAAMRDVAAYIATLR
jgi:cytochrome c oxidase subunit 2